MMIGSATQSTTGKKILGIFVAIAMVLTMSNISAYYASADEDGNVEDEITLGESAETTEEEVEVDEPAESVVTGTEEGDSDTEDSDITDTEDVDSTPVDEVEEPEENPVSDEPVSDEPVVTTKSLKVTVNVYDEGVLAASAYDEKLDIPSNAASEPIDVEDLVTAAKDEAIAKGHAIDEGLALDTAASTKIRSTVKLSQNDEKSKEYTFDLYYLTDVIGEGQNNNASDQIPDKYQGTITYKVVNGAWNDGTTEDVAEVVTFYDENGDPSQSVTATAALGYKPAVGNKPSAECLEGIWNVDLDDVVTGYSPESVFTYTYHSTADTTHVISATVNYFLDGNFSFTGYISASCDLDQESTLDLGQVNERDAIAQAVWSKTDYPEGIEELTTLGSNEPSKNIGTIRVDYMTDKIGVRSPNQGDGIADVCQITVNYNIVNGRLDFETDATKVYTLMDGDAPAVYGKAVVKLPSHNAYYGFTTGAWKTVYPNGNGEVTLTSSDNGRTIEYEYALGRYDYYVYYQDAATMENIKDPEVKRAYYLDEIKANDELEQIGGWVYSQNSGDIVMQPVIGNTNHNNIVLYYDKDNNKDGIADKYQKTVTYRAINGTIKGATSEVVTLYDGNGNFSEFGVGHLTHIPTFTPNKGYKGGDWTPSKPTGYTSIKDNTEFVVTYTEIPEEKANSNTKNGSDNGDEGTENETTPDNGNQIGVFTGQYVPVVADDQAATEDVDEGNETEDEASIEDNENPLVSLDEGDAQYINDDANALAEYEEGSEQSWLPFASVAAGIAVMAGGIWFVIARRRKSKEEAR